jgi:dTDP-4-dehydrorhamnose reductase
VADPAESTSTFNVGVPGRDRQYRLLRLAADCDELAVRRPVGNPTSALDIADAILHSAAMLHGNRTLLASVFIIWQEQARPTGAVLPATLAPYRARG